MQETWELKTGEIKRSAGIKSSPIPIRKRKAKIATPVQRPIVKISPEENYREILKKNKKVMSMLRNN